MLKLQLRICLACSNFNLYHNCYKASGFTFFIFYFKGREFCAGQIKVCSTHWPHEGWSGVLLQHVGSNSHGVRSQASGQNLSTHLLEIFDPSILILCEWTNGVEWKTHQIVRHEVVVLCQWLKYCSYLCASHTNPVGDMGTLVFSFPPCRVLIYQAGKGSFALSELCAVPGDIFNGYCRGLNGHRGSFVSPKEPMVNWFTAEYQTCRLKGKPATSWLADKKRNLLSSHNHQRWRTKISIF